MAREGNSDFPSGNMGAQDQGDDETIKQGGPIPNDDYQRGNFDHLMHGSFPRPVASNGGSVNHRDPHVYRG
jgi:hypothetical protein